MRLIDFPGIKINCISPRLLRAPRSFYYLKQFAFYKHELLKYSLPRWRFLGEFHRCISCITMSVFPPLSFKGRYFPAFLFLTAHWGSLRRLARSGGISLFRANRSDASRLCFLTASCACFPKGVGGGSFLRSLEVARVYDCAHIPNAVIGNTSLFYCDGFRVGLPIFPGEACVASSIAASMEISVCFGAENPTV